MRARPPVSLPRDRVPRAAAAIALAGWGLGCGPRIDVVVTVSDAQVDAPPAEACAHATLSGVTRVGEGSLSTLALAVRQHALCTCTDYSGADALRVFDGDVAIDGALLLASDAEVGGDLRVAGGGGLSLGRATLVVGGSLAVGGPLLGSDATVEVGGDAAIDGRVQLAALDAGGRLSLPADAALEVGDLSVPAAPTRTQVDVLPDCGCGDDDRLDAAAEAWVLPPPVADEPVTEACAAHALQSDTLPRDLRAAHSALLVIDGDLHIDGPLTADVAAGETLDLVVLGNVRVDGMLRLGDPAGGQVRLFVAGAGTIELREGGRIHGLLHAPDAELVLPAPLEVDGSLLLRRVAAEAALTITTEESS